MRDVHSTRHPLGFIAALVVIAIPALTPSDLVGQQDCEANLDVLDSHWECEAGYAVVCPQGDGTMTVTIDVYAMNSCTPPGPVNPELDETDINLYWVSAGPCGTGAGEGLAVFDIGGWHATGPTVSGYTTILQTPCASGFLDHGHVMVAHGSSVFQGGETNCLPILVTSPDFDRSGVVDAEDFAFYGSYSSQADVDPNDPGSVKTDLNRDGHHTSSDFAIFGSHYNHSCADCPRSTFGCNP